MKTKWSTALNTFGIVHDQKNRWALCWKLKWKLYIFFVEVFLVCHVRHTHRRYFSNTGTMRISSHQIPLLAFFDDGRFAKVYDCFIYFAFIIIIGIIIRKFVFSWFHLYWVPVFNVVKHFKQILQILMNSIISLDAKNNRVCWTEIPLAEITMTNKCNERTFSTISNGKINNEYLLIFWVHFSEACVCGMCTSGSIPSDTWQSKQRTIISMLVLLLHFPSST